MQNEDIFIGKIFQIIQVNIVSKESNNSSIKREIKEQEIKTALLIKKSLGIYKDLETGMNYPTFSDKVGTFYIKEYPPYLIPMNKVLPPEVKNKKLTRRIALKRFQELNK